MARRAGDAVARGGVWLEWCAGGASMFNWLLKHWIVGPYILTVFRPWIQGMEHIPAKGPVIIAGNHLSFIDSVLMPLVVRRRVYFLAKSEYFTGRGIKGTGESETVEPKIDQQLSSVQRGLLLPCWMARVWRASAVYDVNEERQRLL